VPQGDNGSSDSSVILPMTVTGTNNNTNTHIASCGQLFDSDRLGSTKSPRATTHTQASFIRSNNEETAMSRKERVKIKMKNFMNHFAQSSSAITGDETNSSRHNIISPGLITPTKQNNIDNDKNNADDDRKDQHQENRPPQYRLDATHKSQRNGFFSCFSTSAGTKALSDNLINPNEHLARLLHWMFRSSFFVLFAVMCTLFFGWIILFAGFIIAAGKYDHECVRVGGEPFNNADSQFADAFTLSWTTFSTVGYGSTYPALSHENDDPANCFFITFICSLESFLGVLYSGFCGAILFGKILRIQSHAQVIFSDPIVVRYGSGMQEHCDKSKLFGDDEENINEKIPCPVLEFGIVNRLFGEPGGEIIDASLNVVANVNARDADPVLIDALGIRRSKHLRTYSYRGEEDNINRSQPPFTIGSIISDTMSDDDTASDRASFDSRRRTRSTTSTIFDSLIRRQHQTIDEDPSSRLVNKRIFSKMAIEAAEHPYFKRRWVGRHVLDEDSPIVKPRVKRLIRKNKGYWPESLNNYSAVRESILFNQILVSLNGVSNLSASEVYAQKIYDFVDMNVGYQFVNTLYKDKNDGTLKVDTDLINDVREQHGGGGEPLILGD